MRSYPYIVQKHGATIVSLEEAKKWLRLDITGYTAEDDYIQGLIDSAVDYVEKEINVSLGVSTYEWNTTCLPTVFPDTFHVQEVTGITQTVDDLPEDIAPGTYSLRRVSERRSILVWNPSFRTGSDVFKVTFTAGHPEGKVPPRLIMGIRALVSGWYDNRLDPVSEKKTLSDKLLAPFVIGYAG